MPSTKKTSVPQAELALYLKLLEALDDAEAKSNFGSAYTAINGSMYSMISKHGVVGIRLPAAEREAFMREYGAELFRGDPAGRPRRSSSPCRPNFLPIRLRCSRISPPASRTLGR